MGPEWSVVSAAQELLFIWLRAFVHSAIWETSDLGKAVTGALCGKEPTSAHKVPWPAPCNRWPWQV